MSYCKFISVTIRVYWTAVKTKKLLLFENATFNQEKKCKYGNESNMRKWDFKQLSIDVQLVKIGGHSTRFRDMQKFAYQIVCKDMAGNCRREQNSRAAEMTFHREGERSNQINPISTSWSSSVIKSLEHMYFFLFMFTDIFIGLHDFLLKLAFL